MPKHQQAASTRGTPPRQTQVTHRTAPPRRSGLQGLAAPGKLRAAWSYPGPSPAPNTTQPGPSTPKSAAFIAHHNTARCATTSEHRTQPQHPRWVCPGVHKPAQPPCSRKATHAWGWAHSAHLPCSSKAKFQDPSSLQARWTHPTALLPLPTSPQASQSAPSQGFELGGKKKPHKCLLK